MLLVADSHLGFDWPSKPRVERRRRGDDFYENLARATRRALAGDVDLLVHGGDLFHAPEIPLWVAERGYALLLEVAAAGVPVALVPGNHERARLPYPLLCRHERVVLFDRPKSLRIETEKGAVTLAGFPYARRVRASFRELLAETRIESANDETRLLLVHHAFEGATVGAHDWVFRDAEDVVRGSDVPAVSAVLSGHIHRQQVLTHDLAGHLLRAPVAYPGSVERTSSAERFEDKGLLLLDFEAGRLVRHERVPLPARPMRRATLAVGPDAALPLRDQLERLVATTPRDAVLELCVSGTPMALESRALGARALRELFPESVNVRVSPRAFAGEPRW